MNRNGSFKSFKPFNRYAPLKPLFPGSFNRLHGAKD